SVDDVVSALHDPYFYLGAPAEAWYNIRTPVDAGLGPNLLAAVQDDAAQLGNIHRSGLGPGGAEARLSDARAGQKLHPVAQQGEADSDASADQAVAANLDARSDHGVGADAAAAPDADAFAQDRARLDHHGVVLSGLGDRNGAVQTDRPV